MPAVAAHPGSPEIPEIPEVPVSATNLVLIPAVPRVPAVPPTPYQPPTYRPRTDYSAPTPLSTAAGVTNTARDAYKMSYDRHIEFCSSRSTLTAALLLSIGQELTGRISDPVRAN